MSKRNSKQITSLSASLRARSTLIYVVAGLLSLLSLFHFFYMFISSTWSNWEILSALRLYPGRLSQLATNLANLNARSDFSFPIGFKNSFIISTAATALTVYFSALTAYGIKVYNFKLRNAAFTFILIVLMVP